MTLFKVILKLLRHFAMVSTEEHQQLAKDIEDFEATATPDSEDKVKATYGKLHKGLYVRLGIPFLYFFAVRALNEMITPTADKDWLEEEI